MAMPMGFGPPKPLSEIMFEKFDADKSGHIDPVEFQQLCFALGYALSPVEITLAVKVLDANASGKIEKKEFVSWWKKSDRWESLQLDDTALAVRTAAADAFNEVDSGKKGVISTADFDKFYRELTDSKLTDKTKDKCLEDLDTNGDKQIQFGEYIDWLQRIGTIKVKVEVAGVSKTVLMSIMLMSLCAHLDQAAGMTHKDLKPTR